MTGVWFSSHQGSPLMSLHMRKDEGVSEEIMFQEEEEVAHWSCHRKLVGKFEDEEARQCGSAVYVLHGGVLLVKQMLVMLLLWEATGSQQFWWAPKCLKLSALNKDRLPGNFSQPKQHRQLYMKAGQQLWAALTENFCIFELHWYREQQPGGKRKSIYKLGVPSVKLKKKLL